MIPSHGLRPSISAGFSIRSLKFPRFSGYQISRPHTELMPVRRSVVGGFYSPRKRPVITRWLSRERPNFFDARSNDLAVPATLTGQSRVDRALLFPVSAGRLSRSDKTLDITHKSSNWGGGSNIVASLAAHQYVRFEHPSQLAARRVTPSQHRPVRTSLTTRPASVPRSISGKTSGASEIVRTALKSGLSTFSAKMPERVATTTSPSNSAMSLRMPQPAHIRYKSIDPPFVTVGGRAPPAGFPQSNQTDAGAETNEDSVTPRMETTEIHLDSQILGRWIVDHLTKELTRPPVSTNSLNSYTTPMWPGQFTFD